MWSLVAQIGTTLTAKGQGRLDLQPYLYPWPSNCMCDNAILIFCTPFLDRALKTRGNTPKYGLIFHSSFIGRAGVKNKGRISRYLANKCSIASRIDCFTGNRSLQLQHLF